MRTPWALKLLLSCILVFLGGVGSIIASKNFFITSASFLVAIAASAWMGSLFITLTYQRFIGSYILKKEG